MGAVVCGVFIDSSNILGGFSAFAAVAVLKQIPFSWRSWSGSPLSSCRSEVLCRLGNIACDSELVQMLLIDAEILWALRFMSQCGTEDILRVGIARPASCLFWEIRLGILPRRTCSKTKADRNKKNLPGRCGCQGVQVI